MRSRLGGVVAGVMLGLVTACAAANSAFGGITREQLYYLLVAEFATAQRVPQLAIPAWQMAAKLAPEANVLRRATQVTAQFGDFPGALQLAERWRAAAPGSADADQFEAALLLTTGKDEQAIQLLQATLARFPDNPNVTLQLAELLVSHGRSGEARRLLSALADKDPDSASAYYALGRIDLAEKRPEHAISWLDKATSLRPDWQEAAIGLAEALQATHNFTAALQTMQSFTASHPDATFARQYLAFLYLKMGGLTQAYRIYQQLAQQYPDDPDIALSLGLMDINRADWKGAETALWRARELAPQSPAPLYYLGRLYESQGRWAEALQWYQRIHSGPLHPEAELRSARVEYLLGHHENAMKKLQKLATEHPQEARIPLLEVELLRSNGHLHQALQAVNLALQRMPDQADLWYAQGVVYEQLKDYPAMENAMRTVIRLVPDSAEAYNFIGYSLVERHRQLAEAQKLLSKALRLAPENPEILDSVGWLLHLQGDNSKALEYLQKAHAGLPDDAEVSAHLGRVLWSLGRHPEARQVWHDALRKHPDNAVLKSDLARQP
ncbi:tetratricopeptide repeat protein [Acidithiobacillus ferrianus]|uniref:Tetratricopeptide repeat protein n=2 Tax=Acidithiobacillus ferrianus TaxID=2678518 RepID=A0A845U5R4_9PROT|nr:tetratricopeptide repeat protein [Acidithiobacillus ferrianus]NDU41529.1 tetratricopeptide repeat protein [Acidithiobacillus ferrianus]